jgi:hypothetical protein
LCIRTEQAAKPISHLVKARSVFLRKRSYFTFHASPSAAKVRQTPIAQTAATAI